MSLVNRLAAVLTFPGRSVSRPFWYAIVQRSDRLPYRLRVSANIQGKKVSTGEDARKEEKRPTCRPRRRALQTSARPLGAAQPGAAHGIITPWRCPLPGTWQE